MNNPFIYLFLLLISFVASQPPLCKGRGYRDKFGLCQCQQAFFGANCEYTRCPFGASWLSKPAEDYQRNDENVPCSNMGSCDILTGKCTCRPGFEGRACERISCPTSTSTADYTTLPEGAVVVSTDGSGQQTYSSPIVAKYPVCSGHGMCMTMRQAGISFNGQSLIRPPVEYANWDADQIQGCICDDGYTGYDCSQQSCPVGLDPLSPTIGYDQYETVYLQCRANSGYFAFLIQGKYTDPIPYDADPGLLKFTLESLPSVGSVTIVTIRDVTSDNDGYTNLDDLPTVCSDHVIITTAITFSSRPGPFPPVKIITNTSNTRRWPQGSEPLTYQGETSLAVLRLATRYTITCPMCVDCRGLIYFTYRNDISSAVNISAYNFAQNVKTAIENYMPQLSAAKWGLAANVTILGALGNDRLCSEDRNTTAILELYSIYGNIQPAFGLLVDAISGFHGEVNISMSNTLGNGTLYECSHQGSCDRSSGLCQCLQQKDSKNPTKYVFRALSSNGLRGVDGGIGTVGDCGFLSPTLSVCSLFGGNASEACSGHGTCNNASYVSKSYEEDNSAIFDGSCTCFDGYYGARCSLKSCPVGRAFFDEPLYSDTAHRLAECSNNGVCDPGSGYCVCRPGFIGPACEKRDCDRDSITGISCSGRGTCLSTRAMFNAFSLNYGNVTLGYADGLPLTESMSASLNSNGASNWDADIWFECVCSAKLSSGVLTDPRYPSVGPDRMISGYSPGSPPLPGYTNWDCSEKLCPRGDDTRKGYETKKEIQRVVCSSPAKRNRFNATLEHFQLSIYGELSLPISINASKYDIRKAIEYPASIGNVSIIMPDQILLNVSTACSTSYNDTRGGFLVVFETEPGPLPLLQLADRDFEYNVTIERWQSGNSSKEECGGPALGYCNRRTGKCLCNHGWTSSNGYSGQQGASGDCSYYPGEPLRDDVNQLFGLSQKEDF